MMDDNQTLKEAFRDLRAEVRRTDRLGDRSTIEWRCSLALLKVVERQDLELYWKNDFPKRTELCVRMYGRTINFISDKRQN